MLAALKLFCYLKLVPPAVKLCLLHALDVCNVSVLIARLEVA